MFYDNHNEICFSYRIWRANLTSITIDRMMAIFYRLDQEVEIFVSVPP